MPNSLIMLNFSQASENNKKPILDQLDGFFSQVKFVLEIGSGSGQHAFYLSQFFPDLIWQTSELEADIQALEINIADFAPGNVLSPVLLDVNQHQWPVSTADLIYTANSLHIMSFDSVIALFEGVGRCLSPGGFLCIYGPFKYNNAFTTLSNERFDQWLKQRDPASGIRDFENVNELAQQQGLQLVHDYSMPANNQLLVFVLESSNADNKTSEI